MNEVSASLKSGIIIATENGWLGLFNSVSWMKSTNLRSTTILRVVCEW